MVSSANGSPYLAQSVYQLSPNHSGHSSAYSALSASLASLKSRLSARGVTLAGALGENGSQPLSASHLYASQNPYGQSVMIDSSQQQAQQSAGQQVVQGQAVSQPTYLSVSSQQEQQGAGAYTGPPSQANENKTIVLAIPAKINFLTGAKQQVPLLQQQQPQQPQQHQPQPQMQLHQAQPAQHLSVLQAAGEQQARPEYATKQQLGKYSMS